MAKRKRDAAGDGEEHQLTQKHSKAAKAASPGSSIVTVQIVTGSYDRVLHGFTATVPAGVDASEGLQFTDTFMFQAHGSAIRCLALSPIADVESTDRKTVLLASGGTDERINLYSLSAFATAASNEYPAVPTLAGKKILENPNNRELGSLLHHSASILALHFPSRSKLLAAAEDNTISVTKTRDWTVVSTIKAPRPKTQGRPSGDTAPPGAAPCGVNDFAVHPSMKLMVSVGRGEKCMRLWNLVTGKKAGVLNFSKEVLQSVKEGKHSKGEGQRIEWNAAGDEFAVAFDRGAVVFGTDSTATCRVLPSPPSKLHQMKYIDTSTSADVRSELLAVSTEDGRVIFYTTTDLLEAAADEESHIPYASAVAQLGGKPAGLSGRVKDYDVLRLAGKAGAKNDDFLVITGSSDGIVRIWRLCTTEIQAKRPDTRTEGSPTIKQIGQLLGTYETGHRITCLRAFVMLPPEESAGASEDGEDKDEDDEEDDEDEDEEGDDEV